MVAGCRNVEFFRRRTELGLTQFELAERLTAAVQAAGPAWAHTILTREYVYRLESGRVTWPNAVYRAALRSVLGVERDTQLGLYCQRVSHEMEADMRRRAFLATLPAVALTGSTLSETVAAATAGPVAPPPRRVGVEHVHQVRDLFRQATVLDHRYGGGLAGEILAGQVRWATGLLDSHVDNAVRADLYSAVGDLCFRTAWTVHDAGAHDLSRHYHVAALRCAEEADDWDLRAMTLGAMANVAAHCGHGDEALTLAQQAGLRSDRLDPFRRARGTLKDSYAYARVGEVQACLAAIGSAEDTFAGIGMADEVEQRRSEGLRDCTFGLHDLHGEAATALSYLAARGQVVELAVARFRQAILVYPENQPRSKAMDIARLATLIMRTGDPAEAAHLGNQALDAAVTVRSARLADDLRHLHRATTRHRGNPDVDALRHRAARTLAGA